MNKRVKIIHWNISKRPHPVYVLRKYEDVLFSHIKELRQDWDIGRIWQSDGKILGSTAFSWEIICVGTQRNGSSKKIFDVKMDNGVW